jgi:hypothetical protein
MRLVTSSPAPPPPVTTLPSSTTSRYNTSQRAIFIYLVK